jgi:hypothetical protein
MLSSPIIIFYSFLVLVVFAIGVAPTAIWKRFGASVAGAADRARRDRAAAHFKRATAAVAFTADIDYVPVGIGFAFDQARSLLFLAGDHFDTPAEAVIPITDLRAYTIGVITGGFTDENYVGFTDENYVDLFPADPAVPRWRISCAEDVASTYAIDRLLTSLGLPKP